MIRVYCHPVNKDTTGLTDCIVREMSLVSVFCLAKRAMENKVIRRLSLSNLWKYVRHFFHKAKALYNGLDSFEKL